MSNIKYRYDIDGLRAIAVLVVIINHTNAAWLPGGFVGVDVFLVISGFLISSIIYPRIESQTFTLLDFYQRRVKRLLPALFFMLFTVLIVGWLLFLQNDFIELTRSARYTAFFTSNLFFADNTDYFAAAIYETPLVHTWSLAVEEQFYIFWPLMLMALLYIKKQWVIPVTVLFIIASITLATITAAKPSQAMFSYYQLPTRMGELLIGALLAFTLVRLPKNKALQNTASWIGVGFIAGALWLVNSETVFPGVHALWPCIGTAAIIYGGSNNRNFVHRFLAQRYMVFVGALSYSLYLWHWPILSFARYYTMQVDLSWQVSLMCAVATFVLSYIAWRWVEEPFRYSKLSFKKTCVRYFLIPGVIVLLIGLIAKNDDIYLLEKSDLEQSKIAFEKIGCTYRIHSSCRIGSQSLEKIPLLVFGDSHARHFSFLFHSLGEKYDVAMDFVATNDCPFLLDSRESTKKQCRNLSSHVTENIQRYPFVIMSHKWDAYFSAKKSVLHQKSLQTALQQAGDNHQQVFLLEQVPGYQKSVMRAYRFGHSNQRSDNYLEANKILADIASAYEHVHIVSVNEFAEQWSEGVFKQQALYIDDNHLAFIAQRQLLTDVLSQPNNSLMQVFQKVKNTPVE